MSQLTKAELVAKLNQYKITFDPAITNAAMEKLISDYEILNNIKPQASAKKVNLTVKTDPKVKLAQLKQAIVDTQAKWDTLTTQAEKDAFVDGIDPTGLLKGYLSTTLNAFATNPATDLPVSDIIKNIPVRVIEQMIFNTLINEYPGMSYVPVETVRNGLKQLFYQDYRDVGNASGFADVVIGDYNKGTEPVFTEVFQVDTEISKGYDILSGMLNDITVKGAGFFLALVADYAVAISWPFAKHMFKRFVTFLDADASASGSYDFITEFANTLDAKEKAKIVSETMTKLGTPSRNNLVKKPTGSQLALEKMVKSTELVAIVNAKYDADYKFDFASNAFQLDQTTFKIANRVVLDFNVLANEYSLNAVKLINTYDIIFMEKGVYFEIMHYDGTKIVETPKLKTVLNEYRRIGNGRRKDKILFGFKTAV